MELWFLPEAEADVAAAADWYRMREAALEPRFLAALGECLTHVREAPEAHPRVHGRIRRALLRRFPYAVFFLEGERSVLVLACFHAARDPQAWRRRIGSDP